MYLNAHASEMALQVDNRRRSNGELYLAMAEAALGHPVSRQWKGYWHRQSEGAKVNSVSQKDTIAKIQLLLVLIKHLYESVDEPILLLQPAFVVFELFKLGVIYLSPLEYAR